MYIVVTDITWKQNCPFTDGETKQNEFCEIRFRGLKGIVLCVIANQCQTWKCDLVASSWFCWNGWRFLHSGIVYLLTLPILVPISFFYEWEFEHFNWQKGYLLLFALSQSIWFLKTLLYYLLSPLYLIGERIFQQMTEQKLDGGGLSCSLKKSVALYEIRRHPRETSLLTSLHNIRHCKYGILTLPENASVCFF